MDKLTLGDTASPSLVALSSSVRDVASALLRIDESDPAAGAALREAQRWIDEARDRLARVGRTSDTPRVGPGADAATTRPYYFPGALEPSVHVGAPAMTATQDGPRRFGTVRFELIHEGPPGCVHGGFLAWMFDQAFGQLVVASDEPGGPTHRLEVTYRRPTPILRELRYDVGTERIEGRKHFARATLHHGETLTAEATALFVQPRTGPLRMESDGG